MKHKKPKRKLVAEINVVPYIDVTLVLLVVFMITMRGAAADEVSFRGQSRGGAGTRTRVCQFRMLPERQDACFEQKFQAQTQLQRVCVCKLHLIPPVTRLIDRHCRQPRALN